MIFEIYSKINNFIHQKKIVTPYTAQDAAAFIN
jgi:hypothetical protein